VSRVLVTGGAGFIGLPMVTRLAGRGEEVHALHLRSSPPQLDGVHWHRVDLLNERSVDALMGELQPERLVHLAWYTKHGSVLEAAENVLWVERSLSLLRAFARHGGRRVVMLGTCAEYDWSRAEAPLSESGSSLAPGSLYGTAKDALRRVASVYAHQEGIELAWGRPFFLYGPREATGRLVPSVIRSLLAREAVATSSGEQVRDFMYVEDVASAVAALLDSSVVGDVNIASGTGVSVSEVVDGLVLLIGGPELVQRGALSDRPWEPGLIVADVTRLRDDVGYRTRWSLAEGLAATVRWWEEHPDAQAARRP
jgi:nucleoside-diphosphate-sugar epimerase